MLRSFRMGNHRSFRDEQELLLMPVYAKDREVLPVAAVYGANASGKSNLLDGLKFVADAVRDSFAQWRPGGGVPRQPFKLDPEAAGRPSGFVVELVQDGVRYTYGVEVDDDRVLSEWLYSYPEKRKRVLFERSGDELKFGTAMAGVGAKLEVLTELLRPNALFLSLAAQSNIAVLLPVYRWFTDRLVFRVAGDESIVAEAKVANFMVANPEVRERVVELLSAADLGISDIRVDIGGGADSAGAIRVARISTARAENAAEEDQDAAQLFHQLALLVNERVRRQVRLVHGPGGEPFRWEDESAGTLSWLSLLPTVLTVLQEGGVLVIDEIDASLHSLLSARLVALFHDSETNPGNGQLIFTTHDATLLHPPLADEVLDRDEVWFVEKDASGASALYPLSDFKPRREDNLERRYLAGQYGAVPRLYEEHFANAVRDGVGDDQA